MSLNVQLVHGAAHGRWREILVALGIEEKFLKNKHGPCPGCGGKDRFRFDDKQGKGRYHCSGCGAGDGFELLSIVTGKPFPQCVEMVAAHLGVDAKQDGDEDVDEHKQRSRREWMNRIWREAEKNSDHLRAYLAGRGITLMPDVLRYHPELEHRDENGKVTTQPAMLAMMVNHLGHPQGLHRTYLANVTPKKQMTPAVSSYKGCSVRLYAAREGEILGLAEGIETALAARQMSLDGGKDIPVWACGNTSLMKDWKTPAGVNKIMIFADNDTNYAGQAAAYSLGHRLMTNTRNPALVKVRAPSEPGDWNDVLQQRLRDS